MYNTLMPQFIRYNIYITQEQIDGLHRVYDEDGVKVAEQIRRALDTWLLKKGQLDEVTRVPFRFGTRRRHTRSK